MEQQDMKAHAQILEMVAEPVTTDEDLEVIFSRFGQINCCEVIRDRRTGASLQYAFIEFDKPEYCEAAFLKMDNVLIDDRRIHVDFSQSVSKSYQWQRKRTVAPVPKIEEAKKENRRRHRSRSRDRNRRYEDHHHRQIRSRSREVKRERNTTIDSFLNRSSTIVADDDNSIMVLGDVGAPQHKDTRNRKRSDNPRILPRILR
uniref:peptidylprolyl isomerase n=1 Tax=Ditylenchus dipsaci TaxID=166011 RepID=A0A915CTJ0_9BILA